MKHSTALRLRAINVVALFVGFYLLALGIVAVLLGLLWGVTMATGRVYFYLIIMVLGICGIILYSIIPRVDHFEAPGPRLEEAAQPRLFERIRAIAGATGQELPREVYLLPSVNAFVSNRGGVMGMGSRRVMGIGLPLMQVLTQSQFSAVIAHEFGHYVGGDTRLGPWIYKTRAAMARTVENLSRKHRLVSSVFLAYGQMFMRRTQLISRAQEFAADALAARVAGRAAMVNGLKTVEGVAQLYPSYWTDYVRSPALTGLRPRIVEGFSRFSGNDDAKALMDRVVKEALEQGETGEYDSHPPLAERVRAVEALDLEEVAHDDPATAPALDLLDGVEDLETQLLVSLGVTGAAEMEPLNWEDYGEKVLVERWKALQEANRDILRGVTPASLYEHIRDGERAGRVSNADNEPVEPEVVWQAWCAVLQAGFAVALLRAGWELNTDPGRGSILFHNGEYRVDPEGLVAAATNQGFPNRDWRMKAEEMGIADLDFGGAAALAEEPGTQPD